GNDLAAACWLVAGVFLGSAAWWLFLSIGVSLLREKVNSTALRWVNRLSGVILLSFGALALWQAAV
ncbi:MAG: LysE family transporter, partial [Desulfobacterales bacterium]|nr:LysE family transporter [Desulfobacterales bacterium]